MYMYFYYNQGGANGTLFYATIVDGYTYGLFSLHIAQWLSSNYQIQLNVETEILSYISHSRTVPTANTGERVVVLG